MFAPVNSSAQAYDYCVALDGSGDFTSLQAAIDACPDNVRKTIFVKNGIYNEKILIGSHSKTSDKLLNIIGEDADNVIITWDDYNGKSITYDGKTVTSGTPQSATFTVNAADFYAENLTIKNTYTAKQAVALYNVADRQTFKNCRIIGYQDTHYLKKGRRSYYYNCYIEGGTDFICAGGTALFENSRLHSVRNGSYITAPEDISAVKSVNGKKYYYGFVFLNCTLTSDANVEVYLGRPWQAASSSIYISCTMSNVKAAGWAVWDGSNHLSSFFAEYGSKNPEGNPVDISQRVSWSYQLTAEEVQNYYKRQDIFSAGGYYTTPYDPFSLVGLDMAISPEEIRVYDKIEKLELYSAQGCKVFQASGITVSGMQFPSVLPCGIYILVTKYENGQCSKSKILFH
jgi:pectinesterase